MGGHVVGLCILVVIVGIAQAIFSKHHRMYWIVASIIASILAAALLMNK